MELTDSQSVKLQTIDQVWDCINSGRSVFWSNTGYLVNAMKMNQDVQAIDAHFSHRNGMILRVSHIETYFGGFLQPSDLASLFVVGSK